MVDIAAFPDVLVLALGRVGMDRINSDWSADLGRGTSIQPAARFVVRSRTSRMLQNDGLAVDLKEAALSFSPFAQPESKNPDIERGAFDGPG